MTTAFQLTRHYYSMDERSDAVLTRELVLAGNLLSSTIRVVLSKEQKEALLALTADILGHYSGAISGAFPDSPLVALINKKWFQVASACFLDFAFVRGRLQPTAYIKRQVEAKLFVTGHLIFLDK